MLALKDIDVYYGVSHALKKLSIEVREGEIIALIGANGAGKTTTLKAISGLTRVKSGQILFNGSDITNKSTDTIVKSGIIQVPEGRRVFSEMSVLENLEMGAYTRSDAIEFKEDIEAVHDLFPRLAERGQQKAGTLSGGEQQMLAIGRALMSRPKCLLLDEPSMGLAPIIVEDIFAKIRKMNVEKSISILLVEQNATAALAITQRGYVLETGAVIMSGGSAELRNDEMVQKAYLGIT